MSTVERIATAAAGAVVGYATGRRVTLAQVEKTLDDVTSELADVRQGLSDIRIALAEARLTVAADREGVPSGLCDRCGR